MNAVLELADVTVKRGAATLLDGVDWAVEEDERWVILGPNGAGKTTLMQICSAQIHPTSGVVGILGEVVGTVDVFELRPRIGWTSAAVAERIPRHEIVRDVVVSASYGVVGRWRERYDELDHDRATALLREVGAGALLDRTFGTLSEGERKRVQIARALMTDPELLHPRRARRRSRPRRTRGPRRHPLGARARRVLARPRSWSPTTSRRSRRASPTP